MKSQSRIRNPEGMKQLIDFQGLELDSGIFPTDIDGIIEFHDLRYIVFEVKHENSPAPVGQKLALQRMVDDFTKSGKRAVAIICEHNIPADKGAVIAAKCNVREVYFGAEHKWRPPHHQMKVREMVDLFLKYASDQPQDVETIIDIKQARTLMDF